MLPSSPPTAPSAGLYHCRVMPDPTLTRPLAFVKMHGAGNDYVYIDGFRQSLPDDLPALAVRISDRHYGVGGDGLICLVPPTDPAAHVRMRMFNNDGSEGEMCGNGVRCVAKLAHDDGLAPSDANPILVETGRGLLKITLQVGSDGKARAATVDMDEPILELARVPVDAGRLVPAGQPQTMRASVDAGNELVTATFVSMGNPHAVVFVDDLGVVDVARLGPTLERHAAFPRRMNVHFVQVLDRGRVRAAHWERGTGITLACGTGACAVCVAGVLTGRTDRQIDAELPGGELTLRWDEARNHVFMSGPAVEVFRGVWDR